MNHSDFFFIPLLFCNVLSHLIRHQINLFSEHTAGACDHIELYRTISNHIEHITGRLGSQFAPSSSVWHRLVICQSRNVIMDTPVSDSAPRTAH